MRVLSFVSNSSVPNLGHRGRRRKATPARKPPTYRLGIEALAERCLLSANVVQANLVSDLPGVAQVQDPNLVNPWGISESSSSPFWISDNNAGVSTLYSVPGTNNSPVSITPLVVSIPTPGDPLGASGTPTGTVFNIDGGATGGFTVSGVDKNGNPITAAANFLFDTEDGTLVGWNPAVNPQGFDPAKAGTYGIIAVDNSGNNFTQPDPAKQTGAVYTGLTTASSATPGMPIFASDPNTTTVLYAANFRSGQVEVYDTNFKPVALPAGAFADPKLPKGYAPFNVQVLGSKVYVTYAKQNANKHDDVGGQGNGFIDVFNLDGTPGLPGGKERLVSRGPLDSPWGLALAPPSFGAQSGDLLVGNFKSGLIDVFNPTTGKSLGNLKGARRQAHPHRQAAGASGRQRRQWRRRQLGVLHRRSRPQDARPVRLADAGGAGGGGGGGGGPRRHGRPHVSQRYFPDRGQPERDDADAAERQRVGLRETLQLRSRRPGLCPAPGGQQPEDRR